MIMETTSRLSCLVPRNINNKYLNCRFKILLEMIESFLALPNIFVSISASNFFLISFCVTFINGGIIGYLLALYLSGTYCHKTSTRTPSCVTPRQPTIHESMDTKNKNGRKMRSKTFSVNSCITDEMQQQAIFWESRKPNWQSSSTHLDIHSKSESTLELQSRVSPSVEYVTTNMVPTQEVIPEEGGRKNKK